MKNEPIGANLDVSVIIPVYNERDNLRTLAAFCFLLGVQFVFLGLIAELLVRTYHESQGKPIYLVRRTLNFN